MADPQPPPRRDHPRLAQDGSIPRSGLRIPMPASTKPPPPPQSSSKPDLTK